MPFLFSIGILLVAADSAILLQQEPAEDPGSASGTDPSSPSKGCLPLAVETACGRWPSSFT